MDNIEYLFDNIIHFLDGHPVLIYLVLIWYWALVCVAAVTVTVWFAFFFKKGCEVLTYGYYNGGQFRLHGPKNQFIRIENKPKFVRVIDVEGNSTYFEQWQLPNIPVKDHAIIDITVTSGEPSHSLPQRLELKPKYYESEESAISVCDYSIAHSRDGCNCNYSEMPQPTLREFVPERD